MIIYKNTSKCDKLLVRAKKKRAVITVSESYDDTARRKTVQLATLRHTDVAKQVHQFSVFLLCRAKEQLSTSGKNVEYIHTDLIGTQLLQNCKLCKRTVGEHRRM